MLHHSHQAGGIITGLAAEGRARHVDCGERGLLDWVPGKKAAEMVFVLEVPNWLSAGCVQLVDMPCLIHKCLHLILILNSN